MWDPYYMSSNCFIVSRLMKYKSSFNGMSIQLEGDRTKCSPNDSTIIPLFIRMRISLLSLSANIINPLSYNLDQGIIDLIDLSTG